MEEETAEEMRTRIQSRIEKTLTDIETRTYAEHMAIRRRIRIARKINREKLTGLDQR